MVVSAGHASSTYFRRLASAFGAGSVATTSNPRARYWAAQLAPMTPVPTMAIRRMGLSYDIWFSFDCLSARKRVSVGDAGEVALGEEQRLFVRSIEPGGIDRAAEV